MSYFFLYAYLYAYIVRILSSKTKYAYVWSNYVQHKKKTFTVTTKTQSRAQINDICMEWTSCIQDLVSFPGPCSTNTTRALKCGKENAGLENAHEDKDHKRHRV